MPREISWREQLLGVAQEFAPRGDPGRLYAVHFANFLKGLMRQGVISDWRETEKNLLHDRRGVDFWIAVGVERFGFQVTSTKEKAELRREKHPNVYVLWLKLDGELRQDKQLERELLRGMDWYRDKAARGEVMFGYKR